MILFYFVIFYMSITVHELAHLIAYKIQGVEVKCIKLYPIIIFFYPNWRVRLSLHVELFGYVLPKITNLQEALEIKQKIRNALLIGPISNFFVLIIGVFMYGICECEIANIIIYTNIIIMALSTSESNNCLGDAIAFYKFGKNDEVYMKYINLEFPTLFGNYTSPDDPIGMP